jgi:hypothetical protein
MFFLYLTMILTLPAEPIPNDPDFNKQWALNNTGKDVNFSACVTSADMKVLDGWNRHPGARTVVVAIIGTGVNAHEEFADRLLPGYVSSLASGDPYSTLDTGHNGTRAAGLIAAKRNNGIGIAGLNDRVLILPVRVADGIQVSGESVADGLIWAADQRVDIAVVLVQLYDYSQALHDAVGYAAEHDVLVIAPAGHDSSSTIAYPAAFDDCLAVSASTCQDEIASFSNFGPEVDLAAPGQWIWSTTAGGGYGYEANDNSFGAAAHVAGVASLLRSFSPSLSAAEIRAILLNSANDLGEPGFDEHFGAGRLNANQALLTAPLPLVRFELQAPIPSEVQPLRTVSFPVRIINGTGTLNPTSPELVYRTAPGPFTGSIRMQALGGDLYSAGLPALRCGESLEFYLLAGALSGLTAYDPSHAPTDLHQVVVDPDVFLFEDDFEEDLGWEVASVGTETKGVWVRDEPIRTGSVQSPIQPDYDRSENEKSLCFFTGQHVSQDSNVDIGANDVDFGPVTLTSPIIDIAQHQDVEVRFACWLYSVSNTVDSLIVQFSRDAGATWTTAATISPTDGWVFHSVSLSGFPAVTGSQFRARFTISDILSDSLTEAAIDEFSVMAVSCKPNLGDANGDGAVNLRDMGILGECILGPAIPRTSNCASIDLNADTHVDLRDTAVLFRSFHPTD